MLAIHNRREGDYRNEQIIDFEILKNTFVINKQFVLIYLLLNKYGLKENFSKKMYFLIQH